MKAGSRSEGARFGWRMPVYGALAAVLIFVPLLISSSIDVLYWFLILPALAFTGLCVLIYAAVRKDLWVAMMVPVLGRVSGHVPGQLLNTHFHEVAFVVGAI